MVFKVSKLYWPTVINPKNAIIKSNNVISRSQKLMTELGLIKPAGSGCFHILPIAQKALDNCCNLIRGYLSKINGQKVTLPVLTHSELWRKSGRLDDATGELFLLEDKHGKEYVLSPTHEEAITQLLSMSTPISYKQLPVRLFQIGPKFRDEIKPRFGLLRAKEFVMMDLYTFDNGNKEAQATYEEVNTLFNSIFNALEIPWLKVKGNSAAMGGSQSMEYHIISSIGEDKIVNCESCGFGWNAELYENTSQCPSCQSKDLLTKKGIEIAHTFLLEDKYSSLFGAMSLQSNGKQESLEMGCYGIGITRTLAGCIEALSREDELVWPTLLAPFDICVIPPKQGSKEQTQGHDWVEKICHEAIQIFGEEWVLLDDRTNMTIGKRLVESKRMGYPLILVIGSKVKDAVPKFELHYSKTGISKDLEYTEILQELTDYNVKKEELKVQSNVIGLDKCIFNAK